ncbi:magnesium/cobalt transporter CorA [Aquimarina agarivorans]|uniref:magnesium/cobalt transporter CorA n=1 Tax=Aquimarina agarivorans TaxID=980584 RepID=UPI000248F28C|nr:magnesium/cobalt transporter CorA [Aquimarina agarivorans]
MTQQIHKTLGQIPGKAIYTGKKKDSELSIEIFDYNKESVEENEITDLKEVSQSLGKNGVTWINVNGLNNISVIENMGKYCNLHPLVIEDIVHTEQRPKVEEFDDYIFVVLKMLYINKDNLFKAEHLSLVVGNNWVVTFQEADGDVFEPIRNRIRNNKGRIRSMESDYLFYALMDAVIDNYFILVEAMGENIEALEDKLFQRASEIDYTSDIQSLKREILRMRKVVFPTRELVSKLEKGAHAVITKKTQFYFRDLYDHIIQVTENVDIYREMTSELMHMYMSTLSNKMNEVMKVLTIISTIFIPLTFLAGIYGMNFPNIPELKLKYGYLFFWIIIVITFVTLIYYFKKKKWL